jgi:hypothetical protein
MISSKPASGGDERNRHSGFRRVGCRHHQAARRQVLAVLIRHLFDESGGTDGCRRIHADLAGENTECSPKLVRQIVGDEGQIACQPHLFRFTTDAAAPPTMWDIIEEFYGEGADIAVQTCVDYRGDQVEKTCGPLGFDPAGNQLDREVRAPDHGNRLELGSEFEAIVASRIWHRTVRPDAETVFLSEHRDAGRREFHRGVSARNL